MLFAGMLRILTLFAFSNLSNSQPNCKAWLLRLCSLSSNDTYNPFSLNWVAPLYKNCNAKMVLDVPGVPLNKIILPFGKPPSTSLSNPFIPVLILSILQACLVYHVNKNRFCFGVYFLARCFGVEFHVFSQFFRNQEVFCRFVFAALAYICLYISHVLRENMYIVHEAFKLGCFLIIQGHLKNYLSIILYPRAQDCAHENLVFV